MLCVLKENLVKIGIVAESASWIELSGGRSNRVWRIIKTGGVDLCVKLYPQSHSQNPLFPNNPEAEFSCLKVFASFGICPKAVALLYTPLGRCLVYEHLQADCPRNELESIAKTLAFLHKRPLLSFLRQSVVGSQQIKAHGEQILKSCSGEFASILMELSPSHRVQAEDNMSIIHADPVPGNIIFSSGKAKLIDWQCPAIGAVAEDLCHFLSPAMQLLYRGSILSAEEEEQFLSFYDYYNPNLNKENFNGIRPWYTWRMACYCLWSKMRGQIDYNNALKLELEKLKESY